MRLATFTIRHGRSRADRVVDLDRLRLVARLETPLGPLTVANTHLSFVPGWTASNCAGCGMSWPLGPARSCCWAIST